MKSKRLLLLLLMALLVPWAAQARETLTVCNGTETNEYLPVYGYYVDTQGTTSEFIIPANTEGMSDMEGGTISKLTFYISNSPASWANPTIQLYLGEVEGTTLSSVNGPSNFTVVKTMEWSNQQSTIEVEFDVPYTYGGGNLLIGTYVASRGNYKHTYFFGVSAPSGSGYCHYSSYNASQSFLPKTTFTYEPASTGCPNPKTFVASDVTAHSATMTWTMEDETGNYQFNLEYKKTTEETWTRIGLGNTRTYPLTGLEAETEYQVRIQTVCEPENIYWKNLNPNLITEVACPAPTNLDVTDGSITAHEATATWEGTSESYVVMIGQENLAIRADFEDQAIPADFTSTTDYPFTVVANTHSGSYCAKSGNGGVDESTSDMVLEVTLSADMTLTFSAKVSSEGSWDKAYFSIDGTNKINGISGTGSWIDYSYPLTAGTHTLRWYYTKDTSTASNDDCFYVDDIVISAGVASWTEYTTTNQTYPFTNLTPNRSYLVKVKGNCGDEGYSQETTPVSFTTLPSCFAPTGLAMVEGYPTAHEVSFTWDYEDGEVFQFALVPGNVTDPSEVNFNTTWNAGDNFPMWNTLSADTDWSFFLRKNCDGDFSDPVYVNFHTLVACPAPTGFAVMPNSITAHTADLTWQGSSNVYYVTYGAMNTTGTVLSTGFEDNTIPTTMTNTTNYPWTVTAGGANESGYCAIPGNAGVNSSSSDLTFVVTGPGTVSFMAKVSSESGYDYGRFLIDGSQKVNISGTQAQVWTAYEFELTAGTHTLIWRYYKDSSGQNGSDLFYVDDINVTGLKVGEWQTEEATEVPFTLENLLAETPYQVTMYGDCGNEGTSTAVGPISFTTDVACHAPTALTHANVKSNQADLSWTNGGAENWVVAYKKTADENYTEKNVTTADVTIDGNKVTYTLTGLAEETAYTVKVRDNCEASNPGDGTSAWTATTSFTTIAACAAMDPVVSDITHYTATVNWTGESADGFTVNYRTAAGIDVQFFEGFEDATEFENWNAFGNANTTNNYFGRQTSAKKTDDYGFSFNSWSSASDYNQYLVSPELTVSGIMTFQYKCSSSNSDGESFRVGLSSTDTELESFTWGDVTTTEDTDWHEYTYNIPSGTKYLCINYCTNSCQYCLYIDDLSIGTPYGFGQWMGGETVTENTANLEDLTPGQKYDLQVIPNCDPMLASEIQQFTTASPNDKWFITEGNWGTAANWEPEGVPTIEQTVELRANVTITGEATAKTIDQSTYAITIEDRGKLKTNSSVNATVKKNINAWTVEGSDTEKPNGYYLIANPITSNYAPTEENGFLVGNYDLYNWSYDAYDGNEWRNYKDNAFTYLNSATYTSYGYLYANEAGTTLTFNGNIKAANATNYSKSCTVPASGSYDFPGVYLLGNGFVCDAYLAASSATGNGLPCYKMNEAGDGFTAVPAGTAIDPMEGVFFVASNEEGGFSGYVYVTTTAPQVAVAPGELDVVVSQGRGVKDNAIIVFGDNQKLGKFSFREGSSKIYIPMEGKDYAVVNAGNVGEMPVSFEAEHNGSYTLSFNSKEVSFSYLHLIDNLTGADVDLLANPSYSFDARTTDYASRFRLVFSTGSSATGDNFGFINAMGNLCIFGIDGTATVQVVDVTGRMLSSETFSGSYERKLNVAPGVYMIRLINGNDVKVQKMIVK